MESKKPLNFAQALRSKPALHEVESTTQERQLSTASDSGQATIVDSQQATEAASQLPPASLLSTTPASKLSRVKSASHKKRSVDSRKGDRHSKEKLPFNNRISGEAVRKIKHFCIEQGMEQQEFAELSAIHFMEYVASHQTQKSASMLAPDDRDLMIIFKTHPTIINLYLQYNPENRWRPADDYEGQHYNDRDIRLIEVGIIQTQFNARFKKINSFKYYTTEIDIALETPLTNETIEIMLKQHRRRWQEATGREL